MPVRAGDDEVMIPIAITSTSSQLFVYKVYNPISVSINAPIFTVELDMFMSPGLFHFPIKLEREKPLELIMV